MSIDDVRGWRVVLEAPGGQTLGGAGVAQCWLYATELAKWVRNPDLDLYSDTAGLESRTREDAAVTVPYGRVYYQAVGITYTGGGAAGVIIDLSAWTN